MDSQQPENRWLHLFCLRWTDDYHPSMGNPADRVTSHKLKTMQGEQNRNKSAAQVYSTCPSKNNQPHKKTPTICERLLSSQVPEPMLRAGMLGLVLMTWGHWLQEKMTAPGEFKMTNHIWQFLGTSTTHHKGIQILSQCVLLPTRGRRKCDSHLLAHVCCFLFPFWWKHWPQLLAAINLLPFSLSLILFCLKLFLH